MGTWRLVSFVGQHSDGRETTDYGPTPRGRLIYEDGGRMSVHIASSDPTMVEPDFGYFGTYTVDENAGIVTHHVEGASLPNYVGTDQPRFFTLEANRLVLRTQRERADEAEVTYVATWERCREAPHWATPPARTRT